VLSGFFIQILLHPIPNMQVVDSAGQIGDRAVKPAGFLEVFFFVQAILQGSDLLFENDYAIGNPTPDPFPGFEKLGLPQAAQALPWNGQSRQRYAQSLVQDELAIRPASIVVKLFHVQLLFARIIL
jgi:hypothetical protein